MVKITVKCFECRQCNVKGKPSVMRGSDYCDHHRKYGEWVKQDGLLSKVKDFVYQRRLDEKENRMRTNSGFRPGWFWR